MLTAGGWFPPPPPPQPATRYSVTTEATANATRLLRFIVLPPFTYIMKSALSETNAFSVVAEKAGYSQLSQRGRNSIPLSLYYMTNPCGLDHFFQQATTLFVVWLYLFPWCGSNRGLNLAGQCAGRTGAVPRAPLASCKARVSTCSLLAGRGSAKMCCQTGANRLELDRGCTCKRCIL